MYRVLSGFLCIYLSVRMVPLSLQAASSVVVCTVVATTKTNLNPSGASESRISHTLFIVVTLSTDL